jgi:hypothetical protein
VIVRRSLIVFATAALLISMPALASDDRAPDRDAEGHSVPEEAVTASSEDASVIETRAAGHPYPPALSPLNRSSEDLEVVVQQDGSKIVDLEGRFQHATVVRILEDGSFSITCVGSHDHETKLLEEGPSESQASPQVK